MPRALQGTWRRWTGVCAREILDCHEEGFTLNSFLNARHRGCDILTGKDGSTLPFSCLSPPWDEAAGRPAGAQCLMEQHRDVATSCSTSDSLLRQLQRDQICLSQDKRCILIQLCSQDDDEQHRLSCPAAGSAFVATLLSKHE